MACNEDAAIASDWTTETADLHVHGYNLEDHGTEVIELELTNEHRPGVEAFDWETTYRR